MGSWELSLSRVLFLSLRSGFEPLSMSKEEENVFIEALDEVTLFWKKSV